MKKVRDHLKKKLRDPYFKELYDLEVQKMRIVEHIINYRISNRLSQKKLADCVGVTQQFVSKIENGDFSNILTLEKVLLFIGLTIRLETKPLPKKIRSNIQKKIKEDNKPQAA